MAFRRVPTGTEPPAPRAQSDEQKILAYQLALSLGQQLCVVIEMTEGVERVYLHDTLDKRSASIAQLVERALATPHLVQRRGLLENARIYATECEAILDVLAQRGSLEPEALEPAVRVCRELRSYLAELAVPPKP